MQDDYNIDNIPDAMYEIRVPAWVGGDPAYLDRSWIAELAENMLPEQLAMLDSAGPGTARLTVSRDLRTFVGYLYQAVDYQVSVDEVIAEAESHIGEAA